MITEKLSKHSSPFHRCFYNCPGNFAPANPNDWLCFKATNLDNPKSKIDWKWNVNLGNYSVETNQKNSFVYDPRHLDFVRFPQQHGHEQTKLFVKVSGNLLNVCFIIIHSYV